MKRSGVLSMVVIVIVLLGVLTYYRLSESKVVPTKALAADTSLPPDEIGGNGGNGSGGQGSGSGSSH